MKKLCCLIVLLIACRVCEGQNLVPNPSFELYDTCPDFYSQIDNAVGWEAYKISPDYFNLCSSMYVSVPNNGWGYQNAYEGNGYAGFTSFGTTVFYRECLGIQLIQPLLIGQKYFVSMKVSRAIDTAGVLNVASNKLGFHFSTVSYSAVSNSIPINNISQVYTNSIITDTINWITIAGSFIADSTYQFVAIGNFFDDTNTSYLQFGGANSVGAYYYVDNICVSTDSLTCNSLVGINEPENDPEFVLFPNPLADNLTIKLKTNELIEIHLFDISGRKILSLSFTNSATINTSHLSKGIYIYEVRSKNGVIKKGKVVKE